jgi:hypothetical protein
VHPIFRWRVVIVRIGKESTPRPQVQTLAPSAKPVPRTSGSGSSCDRSSPGWPTTHLRSCSAYPDPGSRRSPPKSSDGVTAGKSSQRSVVPGPFVDSTPPPCPSSSKIGRGSVCLQSPDPRNASPAGLGGPAGTKWWRDSCLRDRCWPDSCRRPLCMRASCLRHSCLRAATAWGQGYEALQTVSQKDTVRPLPSTASQAPLVHANSSSSR